MALKEILSQPYPLSTLNEAVKKNVFFSVSLTVFLLVFRPFGLDVYPYEESYLIAGYGLVTFLSVMINDYVATHFLKRIFNEGNWKVYRQILYALWVFLFLGVTNYAYAYLIGAFPGTIEGFLKVQLYVLLSCIVPVIILVLWRQNFLLKKSLQEAKQFTKELSVKQEQIVLGSEANAKPTITFTGDNNKDHVSVPKNDLLYIVSKENYIEIIWQTGYRTEKALLRSTLTKAEETLSDDPDFFRSHRAYLVNLKKVRAVEGNAQGYRLTVDGIADTVPVARGRSAALHEALNALA